jgi:hypothetical protein
MLTIKNVHNLINQRIVLNVIRPDLRGTYFVYNMSKWYQNETGTETYHIHMRHINKLHSDIQLVLNRLKTGESYMLFNKDKPKNNLLLKSTQIKHKQTFIKAIERVMIMI